MKIAAKPLFLGLLTLAIASVMSVAANAADIPWRAKHLKYVVENKKLSEFLRDLAMSHGIATVVSQEVQGSVNAKFDVSPQETLDLLAGTHGLIYYFDGNILYIYSSNEAQSEILRLSAADVERLKASLRQLKIFDRRYPIAFDERENTALVSGPKRYVELVQETARILDENQSRRGSTEVRVFPLKYAWAQDYRVSQGGADTTLPGVASTLRALFANGTAPRLMPAKFNVPKRSQSRLTKVKGTDTAVRLPGKLEPAEEESLGREEHAGSLPQIEADGRMNAVLVRDVPERLPYYAQLIRSLDVQPGLIEIQAQIMDISSDALESLGVDWRLRRGKMDFEVRGGTAPPLTFDGALGEGASRTIIPPVASPVGGLFTAVSGEAGRYLIARVSALATEGKARFIANPKVMTLDNVEATLENVNTVHVPVAGVQAVDLFDVSAGTSLRVTPLIVQEDGARRFKLAVRIDDGNFVGAPTAANPVPPLRRSSIGTQAFIEEGESLLIAGYSSESDGDQEVGVPGLSKIPVVGRLFKHTEKTRNKVERLFMLTPRLVVQHSAALNRNAITPRLPSETPSGVRQGQPEATPRAPSMPNATQRKFDILE